MEEALRLDNMPSNLLSSPDTKSQPWHPLVTTSSSRPSERTLSLMSVLLSSSTLPILVCPTVLTSFQHHDLNVGDLKKGAGDKIHIAIDTISKPDTQATTVRVLAENKPGKAIVILPRSEEAQNIREDVDIICTPLPSSLEIQPTLKLPPPRLLVTLLLTAYGVNTTGVETNDEERALLSKFLQNTLPGLVKAGKLKPNSIKLWNGGLDKVDEGLTYLQDGKASAEKVVFSL